MNSKPKMTRFTLQDFQAKFPDDASCLEWLKDYLYPDGIFCEACQSVTKHHRVVSRPSYSCDHCGHHVHPTADTIFHKSSTALTKWFYAIYLMSATRCGISAKQIEREVGVTYKTAWRMFKQIRSMLKEDDAPQLGGKKGPGVEMDEAFFGGRRKNSSGRRMAGDSRAKKVTVVGMVERKGRVKAVIAADVKAPTLLGLVKEHVLPKSTVFTDDFPSYDAMDRHINEYNHRRINHSEKIYVMGDVHTNTIEGFWSLVKNGIRGVYHSVGRHYLQTYLNEYSFRYNRRFDTQPMFISFLEQVEKKFIRNVRPGISDALPVPALPALARQEFD
jgi:transposase